MKIQIKDVMLKELPAGGVVAFDQAALPEGAKKLETKKRRPNRKNPKKKPPAGDQM
jgi:hypothetical protein